MAIKDNLIANEHIAFEARKHWMAPLRDSLIPILLLIGAVLVYWLAPNDQSGIVGVAESAMTWIAIGMALVGGGWIVYNLVVWRTSEFAVTNLRVIREQGLVSRKSSATMLRSVSDVQTQIPFLGERLGYGDLIVQTQSGSAGSDRFTTMSHPLEFRNEIMNRVMEQTSAAPAEASAPTAAPAPMAAEAAPPSPTSEPAPTAATAAEDMDKLARLAELRDAGAITDEEYETKKAEILSRI